MPKGGSVDCTDRHVLAEDHQKAFDLSPFAKADRIAELVIMAAAGRRFVDRVHAVLLEEVFRNLDAAAIGDVKQFFHYAVLTKEIQLTS